MILNPDESVATLARRFEDISVLRTVTVSDHCRVGAQTAFSAARILRCLASVKGPQSIRPDPLAHGK